MQLNELLRQRICDMQTVTHSLWLDMLRARHLAPAALEQRVERGPLQILCAQMLSQVAGRGNQWMLAAWHTGSNMHRLHNILGSTPLQRWALQSRNETCSRTKIGVNTRERPSRFRAPIDQLRRAAQLVCSRDRVCELQLAGFVLYPLECAPADGA